MGGQNQSLHADLFFHRSLVKRSPIIDSAGIILTPHHYNLYTPKSQITCVVQCIPALGKCFALKLLIRTVVTTYTFVSGNERG